MKSPVLRLLAVLLWAFLLLLPTLSIGGVRNETHGTQCSLRASRTASRLARLMARKYGDQSFKESEKKRELADEMADVLWVLICLANQTGVDLTTALQKNFEKKNNRDADRHQQNEKLK